MPDETFDLATADRWPSGVGGVQCEDCGEWTVCREITYPGMDPFDEMGQWLCLPCYRGDDDAWLALGDDETEGQP